MNNRRTRDRAGPRSGTGPATLNYYPTDEKASAAQILTERALDVGDGLQPGPTGSDLVIEILKIAIVVNNEIG